MHQFCCCYQLVCQIKKLNIDLDFNVVKISMTNSYTTLSISLITCHQHHPSCTRPLTSRGDIYWLNHMSSSVFVHMFFQATKYVIVKLTVTLYKCHSSHMIFDSSPLRSPPYPPDLEQIEENVIINWVSDCLFIHLVFQTVD